MNCQRTHASHAAPDSFIKAHIANYATMILNPFRKTLSFSEGFQQDIITLISSLLNFSSPHAICRRVRSVVAAALNRQTASVTVRQRPRFKEPEVVAPCPADVNSTSAVISKAAIYWRVAAIKHFTPHFPQRIIHQSVLYLARTALGGIATIIRAKDHSTFFVSTAGFDRVTALPAFHLSPPGRDFRVIELGNRPRSERLSERLAIPHLSPRLLYIGEAA